MLSNYTDFGKVSFERIPNELNSWCYLSIDGCCTVVALSSGCTRDLKFASSNQTTDDNNEQQTRKQQQVGDAKDRDP